MKLNRPSLQAIGLLAASFLPAGMPAAYATDANAPKSFAASGEVRHEPAAVTTATRGEPSQKNSYRQIPLNPTSQKAPAWLSDSVIYEITPQNFYHPHYETPETWKDPKGFDPDCWRRAKEKIPYLARLGVSIIHVASIYSTTNSLYADRYHSTPSDRLGTPEDIKAFIDEAHRYGLKVISNINWYGATEGSQVYRDHPNWFSESRLFDQRLYRLHLPEAYEHIRDSMVGWVADYGLDGYRLDVSYDVRLMNEVMDRCAALGHPILLASENESNGHLSENDFGFYHLFPEPGMTSEIVENHLVVAQVFRDATYFKDIGWGVRDYRTVKISNHNTAGRNATTNPAGPRNGGYRVKGDLSVLAVVAFGPYVPWFYMGEEFDASAKSVPWGPGKRNAGKFLSNYLDWSDLNNDWNREVLARTTAILQFRRAENDVLHYHSASAVRTLAKADFTCSNAENKAVPFVRWHPEHQRAVLVLPSNVPNVTFTGALDLEAMGMGGHDRYVIRSLFAGNEREVSAKDLKRLTVSVPRDVEALVIAPAGQRVDCTRLTGVQDEATVDLPGLEAGTARLYAEARIALTDSETDAVGTMELVVTDRDGRTRVLPLCEGVALKGAFPTALRGTVDQAAIKDARDVKLTLRIPGRRFSVERIHWVKL